MSKQRWVAILMLSVLAGLAGCGAGRVAPAPTVLDLGADVRPVPALSARAPLVLTPVLAAPLLTDTRVLWREGDAGQPQAYATYRWAGLPALLLEQRLRERLSRQGPVLTHDISGTMPRLHVTLERFEQEFAPDGTSSRARLVLHAVLLAGSQVLGQLRIDQSVPAATADAPGGAAALRTAADNAADELAAWLPTRIQR